MTKAQPGDSTVYLVDGTSQLFRAYFALPGLTNADGLPTGAVYGFTTMLRKLLKEEQPRYLGIAFDLPGPVFRNEAYADYKAHRPPTPEDLDVQVPYAKQICRVLGATTLELAGHEADDLIASLARRAREDGMSVVVVAADKDLLQLVGDGVALLNPAKNLRLDAEGVRETFGVAPEHVVDVLGLMGDAVDNIPGVPGVGEKTALACVSAYGAVDAVIERAGRFVAAFAARDALLEAIDAVVGGASLDPEPLERLRCGGRELEARLAALREVEADAEFAARLSETAAALAVLGTLEAAAPTKAASRALAPLKRALKALDRGSARRSWFAIHEHREQARLSKSLATLRSDAETEVGPSDLALRSPDRAGAVALFAALGFTGLQREFAEPEEESATGSPAEPESAGAAADWELVRDGAALDALVARCRDGGRCALELLTEGAHPIDSRLVGLALAPAGGRPGYLPLGHATLDGVGQLAPQRAAQGLAPLLADASVEKVGWDTKAAIHALAALGATVEGWAQDTRVAAFLLQPGRSDYDTATLARQYLGAEVPEPASVFGQGARSVAAGDVDVERAGGYAARRAAVTLRLAAAFEARLREAELAELYQRVDGPLLPLLARMERYGIRVDRARLERMGEEMQRALEAARAEIHRLAGAELNIDSPKQLRELLFERLGLKPRRKTAKSGVASTDAQTLEELAEQHPIAGKILEYRELAKLKGTYVDALPAMIHPGTGRVHTRYDPTGAATGRLSSADPNLQNIPARTPAGRRIREAFVPGDGFVFLASDYSQIELRVLAHLAADADLVAAFRAGEDIHRHTASRVFGVAADLVTDPMRTRAKAVNFGILYGMSETRLAREQGLSRAEARSFIDSYFERFSAVRGYIERVREQALRDGAVRTMFGRVRYFPQLHQRVNRAVREQALRAAVNTTIQGSAADLMKLAMLEVERRLLEHGSAARMLLQVHDELLLEVPEGEVEATRRTVREAMERVAALDVPLVVDQKTGRSWLEVT